MGWRAAGVRAGHATILEEGQRLQHDERLMRAVRDEITWQPRLDGRLLVSGVAPAAR